MIAKKSLVFSVYAGMSLLTGAWICDSGSNGVVVSVPNQERVTNSRAASIPVTPNSDTNLILSELQNNSLTVAKLVDALGSTNLYERRQAATAIWALRQHYIEATQRVVVRGYAGKLSGRAQWYALETIAFLRPSDSQVVKGAAQHISFSWKPNVMLGWERKAQYAATAVLVRASLTALPTLEDIIAGSPLSEDKTLKNKRLALSSALAIMGPATTPWLSHEAEVSMDFTHKTAIVNAMQLGVAQPSFKKDKTTLQREFGSADALGESFDSSDLDSLHPENFVLQWDLPTKLADDTNATMEGVTAPWTMQAAHRIQLSMALITYGITQRLTTDQRQRSKHYEPYPVEAQIDAVRTLGCLRPVDRYASWIMWQRLRQVSLKHLIEEDTSEDTTASIRALGQIDIPAARLMVTRIANEWAPNQQRATTYVLSKIMGHYAISLIKNEITKSHIMAKNPNDKWDRDMGSDAEKRLTAMLKLGTEKKWFEGEYYGYGDPHAYDLVFPENEPASKK